MGSPMEPEQVWVTDSADNLLLRVDPAGQVIDRIPVGRGPAGVAVADGEVWVANELDGTVSEVNPGSGTQVAAIPAGIGPDAIASGYGSVWVANVTSDTVSRIDAATGDVVSTISLGSAPTAIAVGDGAVWVTSQDTGELLRIDPTANRISQAIPVGQSPDGLAVGAGSVWVADGGGAVTRVNPRTGQVRTIEVGGAPAGVALRRRRDLGRQRRQRHRVQDRSQHRRDPAHTGRKPAGEPGRRRGRVVGHGAALARGPPWRHAHRHRSADITGSPRP